MATRRASDGITFGDKLAFSSKRKVDYHVSDDKKAFEIRLATGFGAGVGSPVFPGVSATKSPISTRAYSTVIPAIGQNVETTFIANGFIRMEPGTHTVAILTVNDQHSVAHFTPEQKDEGFTVAVRYQAEAITEIRLTVVLIAQRESEHPEASALIAVMDLGADSFVPRNPTR